ncbi:MAG TPA: membrane protein insertase YidC, partial [Gemmataceae bacterium]|nr:membrane protein insertase YidC [Gemmataceae bacterium]
PELEKLKEGTAVVVSFYQIDGKYYATKIRAGHEIQPFTDDITVRVNSELIELKAGQTVTHKFLLYHGPVKVNLLNQLGNKSPSSELVARYADTLHLKTLTDYGNYGWWTSILITCTHVMHWLLYKLHSLVPFWGISIILLTVVVRGLMFPISRKQAYLSIKMQELAPEMKKLQEKYKNDSKARTEAIMALYRQHKVHPLGGCLPLFLQMPIFLGLYYCLQESIHFRLAPFLWIPNLAAPDMLFKWGEGIPWISDPDNQGSIFYLGPFLNILPILAVALMIVQQKMMTPPPADEQQAMTQKMMKYMMIFFGIMFYKVAAGLCLYFIASSLWGVAERKMLPKKPPPGTVPATTTPAAKAPPGPPRTKPRPGGGPRGKKPEKDGDGAIQRLKDWWADVLKKAKKQ